MSEEGRIERKEAISGRVTGKTTRDVWEKEDCEVELNTGWGIVTDENGPLVGYWIVESHVDICQFCVMMHGSDLGWAMTGMDLEQEGQVWKG